MVARTVISVLFGSLLVVGILVASSSSPSSDPSATAETSLWASFWPWSGSHNDGSPESPMVTVSKCPFLPPPQAKYSNLCTDKVDLNACMSGVCQTTSVGEGLAAAGMNLEGAANYMWRLAGSQGTHDSIETFNDDTTGYTSYDEVKRQMEAMPADFANNKTFKVNDLGLIRLNSAPFSYAPNPVMGLGAPTDMHALQRPYLETMFSHDKNHHEWSASTFKTEATKFLAAKKAKKMLTQDEISSWVQQMLHKYTLGIDISEEEAATMQSYAKSALESAVVPAPLLYGIVKDKLKTAEVRAQNARYMAKYAAIAKERFPELTDEQAGGVAHGLIDGALTFAGGLSVPSAITSMLGVLYSGVHGDFTAYEKYSSPAYAWEIVRLYPVVVGVPFVRTGTTRREALLLPAALTDKKAWGEDANEFKLRSKEAYEKIDVAWNGFSEDKAYPTESHSCPGKNLAKSIMVGFMQAFVYEDWKLSRSILGPKVLAQAPITWNAFSLEPK